MSELLTIERVAVLQRVALFGEVPGHTLVAVARLLEEVSFEAGATIIDRGSGRGLAVRRRRRAGSVCHIGERTLLETGPGGVVGEFAVLAPAPRSASVDGDRTQPAAAPPPRTVRGAARRPSGDRARRDLDAGADAAGRRRRRMPRRPGCDRPERSRTSRPTRRILLLAGQGFALGLTAAWIMIPASAIFLAAYGSELLPVTYIGAAVAGVVSSTLLAAAFRRRPLAAVATRVLAGLSVVLLVSWVVLVAVGRGLGVVRVARARTDRGAGRLHLRRGPGRHAARCPQPQGVLRTGRRRFRARVRGGWPRRAAAPRAARRDRERAGRGRGRRRDVPGPRGGDPPQVSGGALGRSSTETSRRSARRCARCRATATSCSSSRSRCCRRWRASGSTSTCSRAAAQRYDDSSELARFISQFSAIAYGTDIVFLLVLAGLLLRRFGLRYGLTANAVGVLTVVGAIIVATPSRVGRHDRVRPHRGGAGHRPDVQRRHVADVLERRVPGGAQPAASGGPSHGRGTRGAGGHRQRAAWCCSSSRRRRHRRADAADAHRRRS